MSLSRADLDLLCSPSYLDGLADAPVTELRSRRDACQRAEVHVSYLRRVIQGSIDLVGAEMARRAAGDTSDVGKLVESLPSILTSSGPAGEPAHTSVPTMDAVAEVLDLDAELALEELFAGVVADENSGHGLPGGLLPGANVCTFEDDELQLTLERLRAEESELSASRHRLHERIDALQRSIVDRYKSGRADPDSLLR